MEEPCTISQSDLEALASGKPVIADKDKIERYQGLFKEVSNLNIEDDTALIFSKKDKPTPFISTNRSFEELKENMIGIDDFSYVRKELIRCGFGHCVKDNAVILVHYEMFFEGQAEPFDSSIKRKKLQKWRMGELLPGVEIALRSMKQRELSRFLINWRYAFGEMGSLPRILPKADILAQIEIVKILELDIPETAGEIPAAVSHSPMDQCEKMLNIGKTLFKERNFDRSIKTLRDSLKLLDSISVANDEEDARMTKLRISINANLAGIYMHCNKPEMACTVSQEVLRLDPKHAKTLLHLGRAYIRLNGFEKAESVLKKAMRLYPENKAFATELERLEHKKKSRDARAEYLQTTQN